MDSQNNITQITFHFINGQTESFNIRHLEDGYASQMEFRQEMRHLLDKPWWILHLPEQTICIKIANVLKVEVNPPLPEIRGEDVFSDVRRVTALTRSTIR